jgi:hypothetical protein
MWMARIPKLTLMLLLMIGLGAGLGMGSGQPSVSTAQATVFVGPGPSDCDHCDGCDSPCMIQPVCSHPCVPFGLLASDARSTVHHADRLIAEPSWRLSSVALATPTPPPRS